TDVTGFGLLGHLLEMIRPDSSSGVTLDLAALPVLEGAEDTLRQHLLSSLHPQNAQAFSQVQNMAEVEDHPRMPLLVDPQTSGGLLATVPPESVDGCVAVLRQAGYAQTCVIGTVVDKEVDKGNDSDRGRLPIQILR
ncbi:MAG: AIR synthase-related protein, partial [Leptolyngbyaceae bacterium]|nr:AIR synthase-related protein [Leptolyngbyaceae bacterium]